MSDEPVCIRKAGTLEEASIIVAWLADQGVEAHIADADNPGVIAFGITDPEGIMVFVKDQATAERAGTLLMDHDNEHESTETGGDVDVTCDACGETFHCDADMTGKTQECPKCGAYVDVGSE